MPDMILVKNMKEEIRKNTERLEKLMTDTQQIWEDTGLDPKEPSYLIEKTMRFELAYKNINIVFTLVREIISSYKELCQELEKLEE